MKVKASKSEKFVTHFALRFDISMLSNVRKDCFIRRQRILVEQAKIWLNKPSVAFFFNIGEQPIIDGVLQWVGRDDVSTTVKRIAALKCTFKRSILVLDFKGEKPTLADLARGINNGKYKFWLYRIFL